MDQNELELRSAIRELGLGAQQAVVVEPGTATAIVASVTDAFVKNPNSKWWWADLKVPRRILDYPSGDAYQHILEFIPPGETRCWFVVESDDDGPWHVIDGEISAALAIVGECIGFEYYVVGKQFDWLIAENHHSQLIVVPPRGRREQQDSATDMRIQQLCKVIIGGWKPGLQKVALDKLLRRDAGMTLAAAKRAVDDVLAGQVVEFELSDPLKAAALVDAASGLGAICHVDTRSERLDDSEPVETEGASE